MKAARLVIFVAAILPLMPLTGSVSVAAPPETRLMRYPDIRHDQVVFVYAGDLWIASTSGGQARRLTAHPGDELVPKFSPDGKRIAFTGHYDCNNDVILVHAAAGEPKRLPYHPS